MEREKLNTMLIFIEAFIHWLHLSNQVDKNIFFLHKNNMFANDSVKINNNLFFSKNIDYIESLILNKKIQAIGGSNPIRIQSMTTSW